MELQKAQPAREQAPKIGVCEREKEAGVSVGSLAFIKNNSDAYYFLSV